MVQEKYGVRLATQERGRLRKMVRAGRSSAQAITRARILLKTDEGWSAPQVAAALDVSERTVFRTKRRYAEERLDEVLRHHNQVNRARKVDERLEAHLIALACSPAPDGHDHWTMRALAGIVVELGLVESLSPETVRLRLKKTHSSLGSRNNGASPRQAVSSWRPWRTCWTSTPSPTVRSGRWSASMRPPPSCWPMSGNRCRQSLESRGVRTTNTSGQGRATCS